MMEMALVEARATVTAYCSSAACDASSSVEVRVDPVRRWEDLEAWWRALEAEGWRRMGHRSGYGHTYEVFCPRCRPCDGLRWRRQGSPHWAELIPIGVTD
ncbi:hypothetical protein [Actinomyces faecalis]|uniref:hypothetical protein n=1 Tax=Actinomyces faecalis TaxID=2722820 RepID=UPI0015531409|nr:hypothetical protein [Actinomyces faecalis]